MTANIYLYDRGWKQLLQVSKLNRVGHHQTPALTPDGRYIAFVSEQLAEEVERDVHLYDRQVGSLLPTPGLKATKDEFDPCVIRVRP